MVKIQKCNIFENIRVMRVNSDSRKFRNKKELETQKIFFNQDDVLSTVRGVPDRPAYRVLNSQLYWSHQLIGLNLFVRDFAFFVDSSMTNLLFLLFRRLWDSSDILARSACNNNNNVLVHDSLRELIVMITVKQMIFVQVYWNLQFACFRCFFCLNMYCIFYQWAFPNEYVGTLKVLSCDNPDKMRVIILRFIHFLRVQVYQFTEDHFVLSGYPIFLITVYTRV